MSSCDRSCKNAKQNFEGHVKRIVLIIALLIPMLLLGQQQAIVVGPNLYARPDPSAGTAAYQKCIANGGNSLACTPIQANAVAAEAQNRVTTIFGAFLNWLTSEHLYYVTPTGKCYGACPVSLDVGFDFRATKAFVTDPANTVDVDGDTGILYPLTFGGVTYGGLSGWGGNIRDRNASLDPRIAGCHFTSSSTIDFEVDLPASGAYTIHFSLGDPSSFNAIGRIRILDGVGGTALIDVSSTSSGDAFLDAAGNVWTGAQWPGNEVGVSVTFSGTTLIAELSLSGLTAATAINHLRIVQAAGGDVLFAQSVF